jgi:type 1 glutamine amidotransferase
LPPWALEELGKEFRVTIVYGEDSDGNLMPGLQEALREADVVVMSVRRRALPADDMRAVRAYLDAGKPVVALRTSSHAFSLRGAAPPEGHVTWETWDPEILGGNYTGHYPAGPVTAIQVASEAAGHPILQHIDVGALVGRGSLYKVRPLRPGTIPLLLGTIEVEGMTVEPEPVAWTYVTAAGGRVFYTSLGHEADFAQPAFRRLLANAVRWAAGRIAYQQ